MIRHIFKLIWFKRKSNALMVLEIFLAFLVLFAAFSFVIYQLNILSNPLGFETKDRWMVTLDGIYHKDSADAAIILDQLKSDLENNPLVEKVGFTNSIAPFLNNTSRTSNDDLGFNIHTYFSEVDRGFYDAAGLKLVRGRWFNEQDLLSKYQPIVVNELFMKTNFPNKDMLDSIVPINGECKIVGVIQDYRYQGEFQNPENFTFFLKKHTDRSNNCILLKMKNGTPLVDQEAINDIVKGATNSNSHIIKVLESERRNNSRGRWIPIVALLSICGFLCINVALGLFGVLWYNINKRRSEIGLRRALGAHNTDITKQFVLETLVLAFIAMGLALIFAFQVPILKVVDIDNSVFFKSMALVTLLVTILVLICAYIPSRQASHIHPAKALHED